MRKQNNPEHGQALVEFALIAAILLALIFGAIWGIHLFAQKASLNSVGRDGARWAAEYGGDTAEMRRLIEQQLVNQALPLAQVTIEVRIYDPSDLLNPILDSTQGDEALCQHYGQVVEVTLHMPWRFDVPIVGLFIRAFFADGRYTIIHLDKCWRSGEAT